MEENISEKQLDLSKIGLMEGISIDLDKHDKTEVTIEECKVIQVPSNYTPKIEGTEQHLMQWVLKISSGVLETIGEDEDKIEFRASELFNLIQNKEGILQGFPTGDGSNLMQFMKDLKIESPEKIESLGKVVEVIKGKKCLVKAYKKNDRTYLKFRY